MDGGGNLSVLGVIRAELVEPRVPSSLYSPRPPLESVEPRFTLWVHRRAERALIGDPPAEHPCYQGWRDSSCDLRGKSGWKKNAAKKKAAKGMGGRIHREQVAKKLRDIISEDVFAPSDRADSTKKYRIPQHQRFASWPVSYKIALVDSVFCDYPIGAIIVTTHVDESGIYYNIQDGQTRMAPPFSDHGRKNRAFSLTIS